MDRMGDYIEEFNNTTDEDLVAAAMDNTYEYLVSEIERHEIPADTWMLSKPRKLSTLNQLIEYFTETEEYEKCAELVKIKHTIN